MVVPAMDDEESGFFGRYFGWLRPSVLIKAVLFPILTPLVTGYLRVGRRVFGEPETDEPDEHDAAREFMEMINHWHENDQLQYRENMLAVSSALSLIFFLVGAIGVLQGVYPPLQWLYLVNGTILVIVAFPVVLRMTWMYSCVRKRQYVGFWTWFHRMFSW